jgi:hypothetical protein
MANADTPYGLIPCNRNGGEYDGQINVYYIPSTDGTACAVGDVVKLAGSADADGIPTVTRGTAGAACVGVIVGFKVDPSYLELPNYRAASTARYVYVADDPDLFAYIQEDSDSVSLAATDVGLNANIITAAPSSTTGISNTELNSDSASTTSTLDLQIVRLAPLPDNAIGTNAKWIVKLNNHQYGKGRTGV